MARWNSQELPPEYLCVNRVGSRSQYRQSRAYQNGNDEVRYILSRCDSKGAELHETAKRCANRGHKPEAYARDCQNDGDLRPKRCHEGPVNRSIYEKRSGHGEPQDEQRSAWRSQREHGKQSLHNRELTPNGVAEQSRLSSA